MVDISHLVHYAQCCSYAYSAHSSHLLGSALLHIIRYYLSQTRHFAVCTLCILLYLVLTGTVRWVELYITPILQMALRGRHYRACPKHALEMSLQLKPNLLNSETNGHGLTMQYAYLRKLHS